MNGLPLRVRVALWSLAVMACIASIFWVIASGRQPWFTMWCRVGAAMPSALQSMALSWRAHNRSGSRSSAWWVTWPVSGSNSTSVLRSGLIGNP